MMLMSWMLTSVEFPMVRGTGRANVVDDPPATPAFGLRAK